MFKHDFNYHSHTYLCGHAGGTPVEYVLEAIKHNYKRIGISEHAPMSNLPNNNSRLYLEDYPKYIELLNEGKALANKNNIDFYKGLEIEYFNDVNVYETYLGDMDYLILGQHYINVESGLQSTFGLSTLDEIIIYRDTIMEAIKTGYFNLVAHPDLCFFNIEDPTKEMYEALRPLVKLAKELDIPLELNANGIRRAKTEGNGELKYPRSEFFKIVSEENAKVIISSDAHSTDALHDWAIDETYAFAKDLNLNLINELKMNYFKGNK